MKQLMATCFLCACLFLSGTARAALTGTEGGASATPDMLRYFADDAVPDAKLAFTPDLARKGERGYSPRRFARKRGALSATTAPGAIAVALPGPGMVFRRAERALDSLARRPFTRPLPEEGFLVPEDMYTAGGASTHGFTVWGDASFSYASQDSGNRLAGYDLKLPALAVGLDYRFERGLAGLALVGSLPYYTSSNADVDAKDVSIFAYAGLLLPADLELTVLAGYGHTEYDQTRKVYGHDLDREYNSDTFTLGARLGRVFALTPQLGLRPSAGYEFLHLDVDGHGESGASDHALRFGGYTQNLHRVKAGGEIFWKHASSGCRLSGELFYQGLYGDTRASRQVRFVNPSGASSFTSRGARLDEHSGGLGLSARAPVGKRGFVAVHYGFTMGEHTRAHQGALQFGIEW